MPSTPRDVRSQTKSIYSFIREADPDFNRDRATQVEYEFSNGRKFRGRGDSRGPYANDSILTENT